MKSEYLLHFFAATTLVLGVYIFFGNSENGSQQDVNEVGPVPVTPEPEQVSRDSSQSTTPQQNFPTEFATGDLAETVTKTEAQKQAARESLQKNANLDPIALRDDYFAAWNNRDKAEIDKLWEVISNCEPCLQEFVELLVAKKVEKGLLLEVAIKMAALDTDTVLPVFDALIVPDGDKSMAIILSEKLVLNGRPEFVEKVFDVVYDAKQRGYENFAYQLGWVISKLENPEGIRPILDTITGRKTTSPELSQHITSIYSKVVGAMPDKSRAASVIADYYLQANSAEQQALWPVVSQHGATLVKLAISADQNGQSNNVQKFAQAMTGLPHLNAVDSLMQLHLAVDYSPQYMNEMLTKRVVDNPTIKVLHRLEDYMRNPTVKLESRIFAAEGLLAVRQNRQARYILEKVLNNTQAPDVELQAYIGGRL